MNVRLPDFKSAKGKVHKLELGQDKALCGRRVYITRWNESDEPVDCETCLRRIATA